MADRMGGCLCGKVRYQAIGDPRWVAHCHCDSCRRAAGAPMVTWAGYDRSKVTWPEGDPAYFASSEGVRRGFCPACGTSLTYEGARWPDEVHLLAATLENPASVTPERHVYWAEHLPWMEDGDGLPRLPTTGLATEED